MSLYWFEIQMYFYVFSTLFVRKTIGAARGNTCWIVSCAVAAVRLSKTNIAILPELQIIFMCSINLICTPACLRLAKSINLINYSLRGCWLIKLANHSSVSKNL